MSNRTLTWSGLINGRDLGGLGLPEGMTLPARIARSAAPYTLTSDGWKALEAHGIRSIIDLRHDWEIAKTDACEPDRPESVLSMSYSIEPSGFIDQFRDANEMWKVNTPIYYSDFVSNSPERLRTVLQMIVDAPEGGVLVHCHAGRDRAGLVIAVLLDLLGVEHETIVADHWLSFERDEPVESQLGLPTTAGGLLPLTQSNHRTMMSVFLATEPARRCFNSTGSMAQMRNSLQRRLAH